MVDPREAPTGTTSARVSVPSTMIYAGDLPGDGPHQARHVRESLWRNIAPTLAVVLVVAAVGAYIFWPTAQPPSVIWSAPLTPTSAAPTEEPRYTGPPPSGLAMPSGNLPGWRQTFTEDFNGGSLGKRWWIYDGQPNGDPGGWFSSAHVSQTGGHLTINGSRADTPNGNIYATGGISNSKSFSQVYGKFEVRFRMDPGYGINYIVMLWPSDDDWPPEINIAEDNGLRRDLITSTLHYGGHGARVERITHNQTGIDFTQWHTVGVEWTPGKLVMFLDGTAWATTTSATGVPTTPMSLALQSQAWYCGGNFSDCPNETTPPNVNMEVDWAVAYALE